MKSTAIKAAVTLFAILKTISGTAQLEWQKQMGDTWFNQQVRLQVGDTMPDIPLGEVINNKTGVTRFSQLKGKLTILDFWATSCTSCIAAFPEMEALQKKYGDKIQVFIVNTRESQQQIVQAFKIRNANKAPQYHKKLPDLPSIVQAKYFWTLFPARSVPHHVWIDANGVIRVIGSSFNTYPEKIDSLLSGQFISYLKGDNSVPRFNEKIPYAQVIKAKVDKNRYNSFITGFHTEYATITGGEALEVADVAAGTIRNTWVNTTLWDIFFRAYPEFREQQYHRLIHSTHQGNTLFELEDTLSFTDNYLSIRNAHMTDETFTKSRICYEQIAPASYSKEQLSNLMRQDINNYIRANLDAHVNVEKRMTACWVLREKIAGENGSNSARQTLPSSNHIENEIAEYKISSLNSTVLRPYLLMSQIFSGSPGENFCVIDGSDVAKKKMDIELPDPARIKTFAQLNKYLEKYGLEFVYEKIPVEFMVFRHI